MKSINFTWKYLSLLFAVLSVFLFFNREIYRQNFEEGEICEYLSAGQYYVEIYYDNETADAPFSLVDESFVSQDNRQGRTLLEGGLPAGRGVLPFNIDVETDARNITLWSQGGIRGWYVQGIHLMCYDNFLLSFLFLLLAGGTLVYGGRYYKKEHNRILLLIGVGLLASIPLFNNYMIIGHDSAFHLARINGIYEGLRDGQFPVRLNPLQLDGYGYASGLLYPQLFFYFPAVLKFLNISTMLGMKLLLLAVNMGTVFLAYYGVKAVCQNERAAWLAAVLYTLNPYRLINFYVRGAVGECMAMAFFPLVLWGIYEILWKDSRKWWILFAGMTGVLNSHVLSVEFYAAVIFLELVVWALSRRKDRPLKRMADLAKATLGTVFLNFHFLGPLLRFSQERLRCFGLSNEPDLLLIDISKVFEPFFKWSGKAETLGTQGSMSLTLGSVLLVGMVLFCVYQLGNREPDPLSRLGRHSLMLGSLFLLVALWVAPWSSLLRVGFLENFLRTIQFPWRFLGLSAFFLSVVTAVAIVEWEGARPGLNWLCPLLLSMVLLSCGYFFGRVSQEAETAGKMETIGGDSTDDLYMNDTYSLPKDFYNVGHAHIMCNEEVHIQWIVDRESGLDVECGEEKGVTWSNYRKEGVSISADVTVENGKGSVLASFPLYFYPGYEIWLDGVKTEVGQHLSLVSCEIPAGTHHVEVRYAGLGIFAVSDAVSLVSLFGILLWWGARAWKRGKRRAS